MSKIDRFLIMEGLFDQVLNLSATILDKGIPDHRLILLKEVVEDFGPCPFRLFHSWLECDGFDELVKDSWKQPSMGDSNPMVLVKNKLQRLKSKVKAWNLEKRKKDREKNTGFRKKLRTLMFGQNWGF